MSNNNFYGDAMWDDLVIPATLVNPAGSPNPPSIDPTDGTLVFVNGVDVTVTLIYQLPHCWKVGTDVSFHIHWKKATGGANVPLWQMKYKWTNIGDTEVAYTALASGIESVPNSDTVGKHALMSFPTSTGLISGAGKTISSVLNIWLQRTTVGDTFGGTCNLISADLHIQKDGNGSRQMLIK